MIRVGFIIFASEGWMGGTNYFKNLLYAVSALKDKKIQPVLIFGKKTDEKNIAPFRLSGEVIKTSLLDKGSFSWIIHNFSRRIFSRSFFLNNLLKRNNISVISHSWIVSGGKSLKTINWIGDFQHIHLPQMFSYLERKMRDWSFYQCAKNSDVVVLSSEDSFNDYKKLYPKYVEKVRMLKFVSQPDEKIYKIDDIREIEKRYGFRGKFFYLPNQLWKHKNHIVVLRAVNILKKGGKEIFVLCSGYAGDYRNRNYYVEILKYVKENNLENNIKFLGLIDYINVLALMRHCVSIINPSLFEGWSSTVEEAKSVGKNMILSDLNVHREQNPPNSIYFDPNDEKELAEKLWKKWEENKGGPDFELENEARMKLEERTRKFGETYQNIVLESIKK
jgi:glycosyltransferase involved in cell wall biosynthesis